MFATVSDFHSRIWSDIENRFVPPSPKSNESSLLRAAPLIFELPVGLAVSCAQAVNKTASYFASYFPSPLPDPNQDFTSVLQDAREWEKLGDVESKITLGKRTPGFLYGTATCTYQDSGSVHCPNSQWTEWEKRVVPEQNRSGKSADFFALYKTAEGRSQISKALHDLGVNSYRFSIEWSQIEPKEGEWNDTNLQVYVELCRHLRDEGITPMITLHHFSEPLWFHEKGSFEKEENIEAFLRFAQHVFPSLTETYKGRPLVEHFCTINEPAIEAFSRFVRGAFSPGLTMQFERGAQFLKGAFKAHQVTYEELKKTAPESVKIGIVHQYLKFVGTNPLLFPVTHYLSSFVNDVSLNFFRTGNFEFKMPFVNVSEQMTRPQTDFVGLQYYVRSVIGMTGPSSFHAPMTQMPFGEDPEGLYEAIIETHRAYQAPVIITENGISTQDEEQRGRYLTRALYAAQRAGEVIGDNNLLGYYLWSFSDNFEWDMGMKPQAFGAYTLDRTLKKGAEAYARIIKGLQSQAQYA